MNVGSKSLYISRKQFVKLLFHEKVEAECLCDVE